MAYEFILETSLAGNGTSYNLEGPLAFAIFGGFNSGTAKLQTSPDNGTTWIDIPSATATAATIIQVNLPRGGAVRVVAPGGGTVACRAGRIQDVN